MTESKPESLLGDFRVLDLTDEKGLFCGRILGDFGAEVIKIERPGGDPVRNIGPFYKDKVDPEKSLQWFYLNLNKKSITLNIETADGREIFKEVVKTADFVIESFKPGYLANLGLGYENLEKINPGIIMTSISPYGQNGPYKDFEHCDLTTWAMGGMMNLCGPMDRAPVRNYFQTHFLGGLHGALGSMVAHYSRETTGEGQHVDVSIQQACMLTLMPAPQYWDVLGIKVARHGSIMTFPRNELPTLRVPLIYPCKDGYVTLLMTVGENPAMIKSNQALLAMMDREGVADQVKDFDYKTFDKEKISQEIFDGFLEPVKKWLLTKTKAELLEEAVKQSILCTPVSNARDLVENVQLEAREFWIEVEHPELEDKITYPGAPVKMSECDWRIWLRPPLIGEHNEEIYEKELGFSREQMALLRAQGIV